MLSRSYGVRFKGRKGKRAPCQRYSLCLFDIESSLSAGSRFVIGSLSVFARYGYQMLDTSSKFDR